MSTQKKPKPSGRSAKAGSTKSKLAPPPQTYTTFVERYPKLGEAWDLVHEASCEGPLTERERLLLKLAVAAGALREGAVRSAARKARAGGVDEAEIAQTIALAASVLGFPGTVAVFSWIQAAKSSR